MALIVEIPVPYDAWVVPPRAQNERPALLVARIAMRIPEASPRLRVAARVRGSSRLTPPEVARDGAVEFFTEGTNLLERLSTIRAGEEGTYGFLQTPQLDLPLQEAVTHMTGGGRAGVKALQGATYWNPFGRARLPTGYAETYEYVGDETDPLRSQRPFGDRGIAREEAIDYAHSVASSMRSLPDGRVLIPSVGPVWNLERDWQDGVHLASSMWPAWRAPSCRHSASVSNEVDWRVNVRGDRLADAIGMRGTIGYAPADEAAIGKMEILEPSAFSVPDREMAWEAGRAAFLAKAPFPVSSMWGGSPSRVVAHAGEPEEGWSADKAYAALRVRDAAKRNDPAEAVSACSDFLAHGGHPSENVDFLRIEAAARRLLGRYEGLSMSVAPSSPAG